MALPMQARLTITKEDEAARMLIRRQSRIAEGAGMLLDVTQGHQTECVQ
jgi:hypothetical protein